MAAIQFTDRRTATRLSVESLALARAASAATSAPSIGSGQPWRWRIDGPVLSLYAALYPDRTGAVDVDDARLIVNCGIALHHARTALAADGVAADVRYLPDPADPGLLARISHAGRARAGAGEVRLYRAIAARRSDSRPPVAGPVPDATIDRLLAAARRPGIDLRVRAGLIGVAPTDDHPEVLLGTGEATSAILLTANVEGLATELTPGAPGAATTVRFGVPAPGVWIR
ncbi:hypothetical protein [Virgisporangium ochraceum]|nr:hypothetical protein [Virgisporangium ochraceum]